MQDFSEFSEENWDMVMDVNLKSPFFLTSHSDELLHASMDNSGPSDAPVDIEDTICR